MDVSNFCIPIVESIFFDQIVNRDHPWYEYAKKLNRDGYLIIKKDTLIPTTALCDEIVRDISNYFSGQNIPSRIQDMSDKLDSVNSLANNSIVKELLSFLYGRPPFPFQTLNFRVGTEQHFHSDAVHFNSIPERYMCGVWVALEDIEYDQGPLEFYPKSHKMPIFENESLGIDVLDGNCPTQNAYEFFWKMLAEKMKWERKEFIAEKGDILIWCSNLLHGGALRINKDKTRWSQVTHYYFNGCSYYSPIQSSKRYGYFKKRFDDPSIHVEDAVHKKGSMAYDAYRKTVASLILEANALPQDFQAKRYLDLNWDVKESGVDPITHYLQYGRSENRRYK